VLAAWVGAEDTTALVGAAVLALAVREAVAADGRRLVQIYVTVDNFMVCDYLGVLGAFRLFDELDRSWRCMMPIRAKNEAELDSRALEAALPSLTEKLRALEGNLTEDERSVFSSIVNSAAIHLETIQAMSDTTDIAYAKPISAVATIGVREHLMALPEKLNLSGHKR
jgi:hypothetical protein